MNVPPNLRGESLANASLLRSVWRPCAQATYLGSCWIVGGLAYLFGVFFAVIAPIPPFGVTADVIRAQPFTTGGLFPEQPHRALAFGAIYFGVVGSWEVAGRHFIINRPQFQP
ncbi:MAG: hypothetical protein ACT4P7_03330 [Gemmatimonadaceae bacterium]